VTSRKRKPAICGAFSNSSGWIRTTDLTIMSRAL
jgi:hypothetical protein